MKLYIEPIEIKLERGLPIALRWRGRIYRVLVVAERWTYRGRWWIDPVCLEGERRTYYRIFCDRAQLEIFHRQGHAGDAWMLSRLLD